jgi:hypothetical protein
VSTPIRVPPAPIRVSAPIYDWLAGLKADLERERDRQVTFTEVLEQLRAKVEGFDVLAAHAKVVERS